MDCLISKIRHLFPDINLKRFGSDLSLSLISEPILSIDILFEYFNAQMISMNYFIISLS